MEVVDSPSSIRRLIIGCGYLGRRVAAAWRNQGAEVQVLTRSAQRAVALEADGFRTVVGDVTEPASLPTWAPAATVLYAVGWDRTSGRDMAEVYVAGLRNLLDTLPETVQRVLYISSTSVYGQTTGSWIDETSPCCPARDSGRICLEAENVLRHSRWASRSVVLRLAGIYGPGRIPHRDKLILGQPLPVESEGLLNLIYVDDAVQAVLAAEQKAQPPACYLVSDGQPALRGDFYRHLARLLQCAEPTFQSPESDTSAAQRALSQKRIDSRKIVAELGLTWQQPDFRAGLNAALEA